MYKVVFEYTDGRKSGSCIVDGKVKLFDTEQEAAAFASDLNNIVAEAEEDVRSFFPVYKVEKA